MKGDFSRSTFNRKNGFTSVLMQQGRVLLDADFNEQAAIVLHYLRTLASDLIGPHNSNPDQQYDIRFRHGGTGFEVHEVQKTDANGAEQPTGLLGLTPGSYYVDGILVENTSSAPLNPQPVTRTADRRFAHLFYLDVWERLVTALEDPRIREVALGAEDTCVRTQTIWQLKTLPITREGAPDGNNIFTDVRSALDSLIYRRSTALMSADLMDTEIDPDPCIQAPDSRYRGSENQLYRVEIHDGGSGDQATFKWSRDNGSVTFPILGISSGVVELAHLGRDWRSSLQIGDWVEALDDDNVYEDRAGLMFRVAQVDYENNSVTLELPGSNTAPNLGEINVNRRALLRRWDHRVPSNDVKFSPTGGVFLVEPGITHTLEDGIQITFAADRDGQPDYQYNVGDYWLITARTNGTIDWPKVSQGGSLVPERLPAFGIQHHYAPLAVVMFNDNSITVDDTYSVNEDTYRLRHAFTD